MKKSEINILIVDDDAGLRSSLTETVTRAGYKATAVGRGEEAVSAAKIKQYHAALIDCMLPKTNGVDLSLELRKTRFGNGKLLLMSGVFRDKGFAAEAVEKTKAIDYLFKPFGAADIRAKLDEILKELISDEKVPLHVLVSKPFSSVRGRTKVVEGLEEVMGFDLPFILCVLLDAGTSGHLNLTNSAGEIYGIAMQKGQITGVDSVESEVTLTMMLLEKGYIRREDLQLVQSKGSRGDLIALMIEQDLLSPHVLPIVRKDQMLQDLRNLFSGQKFNINYVPDRKERDAQVGLELKDLAPLLHDAADKVIPFEYLRNFYEKWMEYPIQTGPAFSPQSEIFATPLMKRMDGLADMLAENLTIDEIQIKGGFAPDDMLKAMHFLAFLRYIIFADVKKAKEYSSGHRIHTMLEEIKNLNPFQVFEYFGCQSSAKEQEIEKVYREFARANHPDRLPPGAPEEIRRDMNKVFSFVSDAYTTLSNPQKRQELINKLRQTEAETQIRAENLADEAVHLLKRGKAADAALKTTEAMKLFKGRNVIIAHAWAVLKSEGDVAGRVGEANKALDSIPHEERRNAPYLFVQGLLKAALGDNEGAAASFDRAIAMDANLLEARREKASLGSKDKNEKSEITDIFKADLGKMVGNLFKKRG
jgi:CheY-like chemotaxis protein/curved DNA-binding protein CbpA